MDTCLFGTTALEAYRAAGARTSRILGLPHTAQLKGCGVARLQQIEPALEALGVSSRPAHVLVESGSFSHDTAGVIRHVASAVPARSLVRLGTGMLLPVPELLFVQLADMAQVEAREAVHSGERIEASWYTTPTDALMDAGLARALENEQRIKQEVDLALVGYELCGTYRLDDRIDAGFINTEEPIMSVTSLQRALGACTRMNGLPLARRAAELVQDGAHSPAEASMALLLTGPRRIGGMGLPRGVLNCKVETPSGPRFVDLAWPEVGLGLERQGKAWHPDSARHDEDRRRNSLAGSGMTIITVWHEDLARPVLFERLVKDIARALGVRVRVRDKGFAHRQALLRAYVLPPLHRYDDIA